MLLSFDDHTSDLFPVDNGIGQGETSSMLLYLLYSYGLVTVPNGANEGRGAYIDNNFFLATADNFDQTDIVLNRMLNKADAWFSSHTHAEITKFKCLRFPCPHVATHCAPFYPSGSNHIVESKDFSRLLGVEVDYQLQWHHHMQKAVTNGHNLLLAINRLTWPSFGLPTHHVWCLYMCIVLPKMQYILAVWYTPVTTAKDGTSKCTGAVKHTNDFTRVQQLVCQLITRAFKSTATDILEFHASIPPAQFQLEDACH